MSLFLVKNSLQTWYPPDSYAHVMSCSVVPFLARCAGKSWYDGLLPLQFGLNDLPTTLVGTARVPLSPPRAHADRGRLKRSTVIPPAPGAPGLPARGPRFPAPATRDRFAAPGRAVLPEHVHPVY